MTDWQDRALKLRRNLGFVPGTVLHHWHGKKVNRNDRLLAVAESNFQYANIKRATDLPDQFLKQLEEFFVNYHHLEGKEYRLLGCKGAAEAAKLIKQARRAA